MRMPRRFQETGQAVLVLVIMLSIIISAGGIVMTNDVIRHDPLIQADTVGHFAYRALEAGVNTFMSDANANPNNLTCSSTSPSGGQCTPGDFQKWKRVPDTSGTGVVPEYYAWGNPVFCFTNSCPTLTPTRANPVPVHFVKETVYGVAGFPGHLSYEQSTLDLKAVNGFLTRIWWSTYEATDPQIEGTTSTPPKCTHDWANGYNGPNEPGYSVCSPVVFAGGTQVYGPIFSNDSIYITGRPTLGPVETADPKYLFVSANGSPGITKTSQEGKTKTTRTVIQTTLTFNTSNSGEPVEPLPKTDNTLEKFAALDGCVYTGPTTITFDKTDEMTVWSPGTASTTRCPSTQSVPPGSGKTGQIPNGAHGNGVIYVKTATSCINGANPFDDYKTGKNGPTAQYATTTNRTYHYDYFGAAAYPHTNCEGDAFVSDNPTTGGIAGQLTIGTANDIVITGTIKYQDCGTGFASDKTAPCTFNTTGANDSLGLIAQNYVLINHPLKCASSRGVCKVPKPSPTSTLAAHCTAAELGTPAAALCNPVADATGSTLTIDAAILAINHSFTVDNEGLITPYYGVFGVGGLDGTLKVYGSIVQKWRGTVGVVTNSGYVKDYDWNSIGAVITPPHYLAPSTPSWDVGSSAIYTAKGSPSTVSCPSSPTTACP